MTNIVESQVCDTIGKKSGEEYAMTRKNPVLDDNLEYKDMVCDFIFVVQDYCREHCLPIFNRHDTPNIITKDLLN